MLILVLLAGCARGDGISLALGKKEAPADLGPPLICRVPVPHAQYASITQERAQLDQANNLLQFCMAQWDAGR